MLTVPTAKKAKPSQSQVSANATSPSAAAAATATAAIGDGTSLPPTPTATANVPAPAATTQPTASQPVASAYAGPGRVISAAVQPYTVAPGATVRAVVATQGVIARLELYIGSGSSAASGPVTIPLSQVSPGSWAGTGAAPSVPGSYHFTIGVYNAAGVRRIADSDSWNLLVSGGSVASSSGGVQPLPADVPLAPPFSYGNPQPAVFTAAGQSVNGSVVSSTTRTDVPASDVSSFYMTHLPRAGWSIGSGASPGATSFSIYATTAGGKRVLIVEYSLATLHLYYGNLS